MAADPLLEELAAAKAPGLLSESPPRSRWVEVATGRAVVIETGADGRDGTVVYRYEDEATFRTIAREQAFLCGYFCASAATDA